MRKTMACAAMSMLLAACGGATNSGLLGPDSDGGTTLPDGGASDGAKGDGSKSGPPWPSGCPLNEPTASTSCPKIGLECSYGDSPFPQCRKVFQCIGSGWAQNNQLGECPAASPACPAQPLNELACAPTGATCAYGDGTLCFCNSAQPGNPCLGGTKDTWKCTSPSTRPPECPAMIPNEGETCSLRSDAPCQYLQPGQLSPGPGFVGGVSAICQNGAWLWVGTACAGIGG